MSKRSTIEWQTLFSEHEASGLSAAAFCRQHSLCPKYFSLRKRQLAWSGASGFVQATPSPPESVLESPVDSFEVTVRVIELTVVNRCIASDWLFDIGL